MLETLSANRCISGLNLQITPATILRPDAMTQDQRTLESTLLSMRDGINITITTNHSEIKMQLVDVEDSGLVHRIVEIAQHSETVSKVSIQVDK
jgi:hypothetical protein